MAYEHEGGAVKTTLTTDISATSTGFTLTDVTNWPTGATTDQFWAIFDYGSANEEHVLCESRSGQDITVATAGRGADGTTARAWSAGTEVAHGFAALEAQAMTDHLDDTDLHLGTGSISSAAYFAASVVNNAAMADDAIDSAEIADGAIDLVHMSANSVDSDQYVDASIDKVHLASTVINGYALSIRATISSPADATTYYSGDNPTGTAMTTTAAAQRVYFPCAGIVKAIYAFVQSSSSQTHTETSTISFRLNNTTDTTITSSFAVPTNGLTTFNLTGQSIAVAAGDYCEIKWVTPTWATNPDGNQGFIYKLFIESSA